MRQPFRLLTSRTWDDAAVIVRALDHGHLEPLTSCLQSSLELSSRVAGLAWGASLSCLGPARSRPVGAEDGCQRARGSHWP